MAVFIRFPHFVRLIPICLFSLSFLLFPAVGLAKDSDTSPMKVTIGVSVSSIYDFDLLKQSFNTEFWVWYLFPEEIPDPEFGIE
jgi:hypothetical protein